MHHLIGIDIGGTKIAVTLGTSHGKIVQKRVFATQTHSKSIKSIQEIIAAVSNLLHQSARKSRDVLGIGIGVPGPVSPKKEQIEDSPNLKGWAGIPIKTILKRKFGFPVFLENDANAAALGVKYFGEGRGIQDFVYVTVSTGIGSGIVSNGKLIRGANGSAGEFGHMTIEVNGERCSCGKRGCLEAYASGTVMARLASRLLKAGAKSSIRKYCSNQHVITGEAVSKAASAKDFLAVQIKKRAGSYMGVGLGSLINLLNPKKVILGGGVLTDSNYFWQAMMRSTQKEAWPMPFKDCAIIKTKLGNRVGDLGAMAVALERLQSHK
ncbi:MAG: ROK family protein [Candidatus Omnitrophica bacterium]|nr:ROK family protein [Candidatus Omnitrophota bacterium]